MINLPAACVIGAATSGITTATRFHEFGIPFECFERRGEHASASVAVATQVAQHVHYGCGVRHAVRRPDGLWRVVLDDGNECSFDVLVVTCSPVWREHSPAVHGRDDFQGMQMHSRAYVDSSQLAGKRVLLIGVGAAAAHIAIDAAASAHSIHVAPYDEPGAPARRVARPLTSLLPNLFPSVRRRKLSSMLRPTSPHGFVTPDDELARIDAGTCVAALADRLTSRSVVFGPAIRSLTREGAMLANGSAVEADVVVYCSGYDAAFDFFDRPTFHAGYAADALFKGVFRLDTDNLLFVGLQRFHLPESDAAEVQARLAAEYLSGSYALPDLYRMRTEIEVDVSRLLRRAAATGRPQSELPVLLAQLRKELRRGRRRAARDHHRLPVAALARTTKRLDARKAA